MLASMKFLQGSRLDSGFQNLEGRGRGGGVPSRLGRVHSPGLGLSAGGLFGVQQSNAGGRGVCLLLTPFVVLTLSF